MYTSESNGWGAAAPPSSSAAADAASAADEGACEDVASVPTKTSAVPSEQSDDSTAPTELRTCMHAIGTARVRGAGGTARAALSAASGSRPAVGGDSRLYELVAGLSHLLVDVELLQLDVGEVEAVQAEARHYDEAEEEAHRRREPCGVNMRGVNMRLVGGVSPVERAGCRPRAEREHGESVHSPGAPWVA